MTSINSSSSSSSTPSPTSEKKEENPFTGKRGLLIFLASIGTTLLITGFTGSSLLKKNRSTGTAVASAVSRPTAASSSTELQQLSWRQRWQKFSELAQKDPVSVPATGAVEGKTMTVKDIKAARGKSVPSGEDNFNPALHALKAFGIATAITFGTAGLGVTLLMRRLEVNDFESLALKLSHEMPPFLANYRPTIPSFLQVPHRPDPPEEETQSSVDAKAKNAAGAEETFSSVLAELEQQADEHLKLRKEKWEELKRGKEPGLVR